MIAAAWFSPEQLTEAQQSVRRWFQEGGTAGPALAVLAAVAGALFLTHYLSRRQRRRDPSTLRSDPARLFADILKKMNLTRQQRKTLASMARDLRIKHPTVVLLSPVLFERSWTGWKGDGAASTAPDGQARSDLYWQIRSVLFPSG